MEQIGYSLIDGNGAELQHWGDAIGRASGRPDFLLLPNGTQVHCPSLGAIGDWRLVHRVGKYGSPPGVEFDGNQVVVTIPVSSSMIVAERTRRLASGFDYNFQDARGAHRIGTSEEDMKGWSEVTMASQAAMALGMQDAPINIVTNTGPVTVTAREWQTILLAATNFRQPIWAASFALQGMSPIPADYTNDSYWQ